MKKTLAWFDSIVWQLLSAQDTVTHWNERGPQRELETRAAVEERDRLRRMLMQEIKNLHERVN